MYTFVPSLGSKHVVHAGATDVVFAAFPEDADVGQVEVWSNIDGGWNAHTLEAQSGALAGVRLCRIPLKAYHNGTVLEYTYRIRHADGNIEWLGSGNNNGIIVEASDALPTEDGFGSLAGHDDRCHIVSTENANVKRVEYPLDGGQEGSIQSFSLGMPSSFLNGLTIERTKPTWMETRLVDAPSGLSSIHDSALYLVQTEEQVLIFLPVSQQSSAASIRGDADGSGRIWLRTQRDVSDADAKAFLIMGRCQPWDVVTTVGKCILEAGQIVTDPATRQTEVSPGDWSFAKSHKAVYCTWNSLGPKYTLSKVLERLQSIKDAGVLDNYDSILLDDGWQHVSEHRQLHSFDVLPGWNDVTAPSNSKADSEPLRRIDSGIVHSRGVSGDGLELLSQNLKRAIDTITNRFPNIASVGVWMTLQGYWSGLNPDSEHMRKYNPKAVQQAQIGESLFYESPTGIIHLPAVDKLELFWRDYFTVLKHAGVAYVKIDNQASVEGYVGEGAAELRTKLGQSARRIAAEFFGSGSLINCMAHSPRNYCEFMSSRSDPNDCLRTSDDFFPDLPDSHRFHIANNATSALMTRFLRLTPDYDMFTSHHELADYHARLRAFSAAPIFITDDHQPNLQIFDKLGGRNARGEYQLVKAANTEAVRLDGSTFDNVTGAGRGSALKFGLPVHAVGGALIGAFNCRAEKCKTADYITAQDVADSLCSLGASVSRSSYILYSPENEECVHLQDFDIEMERRRQAVTSRPLMSLLLDGESATTYVISAVEAFEDDQVAVLGLIDKYGPLNAITSVQIQRETLEPVGLSLASDAEAEAPQERLPATDAMATIRANGDKADVTTSLTRENGHSCLPQDHEDLHPSEDNEDDYESQDERESVATSEFQVVQRRERFGLARSRWWSLLFFWRASLQNVRASLRHDLWQAPFVTILRELKAMFGGPATLNEDENHDSDEVHSQSQGLAESEAGQGNVDVVAAEEVELGEQPAVIDAAQNYQAIDQPGAAVVNGKPPTLENQSMPSETATNASAAPYQSAIPPPEVLVIQCKTTGKLAVWLDSGRFEDFGWSVGGRDVDQKDITVQGNIAILNLDFEKAAAIPSTEEGPHWTVCIFKRRP